MCGSSPARTCSPTRSARSSPTGRSATCSAARTNCSDTRLVLAEAGSGAALAWLEVVVPALAPAPVAMPPSLGVRGQAKLGDAVARGLAAGSPLSAAALTLAPIGTAVEQVRADQRTDGGDAVGAVVRAVTGLSRGRRTLFSGGTEDEQHREVRD